MTNCRVAQFRNACMSNYWYKRGFNSKLINFSTFILGSTFFITVLKRIFY